MVVSGARHAVKQRRLPSATGDAILLDMPATPVPADAVFLALHQALEGR